MKVKRGMLKVMVPNYVEVKRVTCCRKKTKVVRKDYTQRCSCCNTVYDLINGYVVPPDLAELMESEYSGMFPTIWEQIEETHYVFKPEEKDICQLPLGFF